MAFLVFSVMGNTSKYPKLALTCVPARPFSCLHTSDMAMRKDWRTGERYDAQAQGELAHLQPAPGTPDYRQSRFWMHYAEGSLMNWLVMKLVFMTIPTQPMPFFVRSIARQLCAQVQAKLVDPNLATALAFMEEHLGRHTWFAGDQLSIADFQMSFAVEAALARGAVVAHFPNLAAFRTRMVARPAYQRALAKGGPVVMS